MSQGYITVSDAADAAPWLIMVHGMTQDHRVFSSQVAAFKDRYRILLIDLPGHGLSTEVPGPYGHVEMMEHVRLMWDQAAIGPAHFWATHTGTAVGLLLAAQEPERFKSLILEGAVISGYDMPYVSETLGQASVVARSEGPKAAIDQVFSNAKWFDAIRADPVECRMDEHWKIMSDFSCAPWIDDGPVKPAKVSDNEIAAMKMPVLIYNGEHDVSDFIDAADHLKRLMPNSTRKTIPGGGGFPAWEYPDRVNSVVDEFLSHHS